MHIRQHIGSPAHGKHDELSDARINLRAVFHAIFDTQLNLILIALCALVPCESGSPFRLAKNQGIPSLNGEVNLRVPVYPDAAIAAITIF